MATFTTVLLLSKKRMYKMITIKNTQRTQAIDVKKVKQSATVILQELGYQDFDLGIWFTTNKTIRYYNKTYRDKDKATDILSFAYHTLEPGKRPKVKDEEDKNLGDLIISPSFIVSQYNISLQERIDTLLIHGVCHLLGYTHYDPENDKIMSRLEKKLAKKLNLSLQSATCQ